MPKPKTVEGILKDFKDKPYQLKSKHLAYMSGVAPWGKEAYKKEIEKQKNEMITQACTELDEYYKGLLPLKKRIFKKLGYDEIGSIINRSLKDGFNQAISKAVENIKRG